jgi:hypothetical protein
VKGERLPGSNAVLLAPDTRWKTLTVPFWYGEPDRRVQVTSATAVWYRSGTPALPLRWVLIRDPYGQCETQALLCTDLQETPAWILDCFVRNWQMEGTFEEARAHLGIETQRKWSDHAIARTTPCLLRLYSIVTLLVQQLAATGQISLRRAAWYPKQQATFSDAIALVRRWLWSHEYFSTSSTDIEMVKIPRPLIDRFINTLCYAA